MPGGDHLRDVQAEARAGFGVAFRVAKTADDRLALATSTALATDGVASIALHPGWSAPRA
jgi:hypothetical protein